MAAPMTLFAQSLAQWADALDSADFATARRLAHDIESAGRSLAIHPDFHSCIDKHFFGMLPEQLVRCVTQFLLCATNAREAAANGSGSM